MSRRDSSERSVGARRAKGKRVTIREDEMDPSDGGSSASEVSDAESESDATPPPRRRRGGGADATPPSIGTSAPPSIGKEKPEAVAAASAAAAAIAEMEHKTRVRDLARRGDKPDAAASSSQVERVWSALPPRAPAPAHVAVSRAQIEKAAAAAVEAALASRMHAPRALEADAAANAAPDAGAGADADADETSPGTKLANAKRAVEVSSASAVKAARKVTSAGKKKRARAKPRPPAFPGFRPSAFSQASSPTNGTFGAKKRAPSSLAAVEAREARLLAELEGKVAALSSGRIRTGRSAVRKALR